MSLRGSSIRMRLAGISALIVAATGATLGLLGYVFLAANLDVATQRFAVHEVQEVAVLLSRFPDRTSLEQRRSAFSILFPEEGVLALEVWSRGKLIHRSGALPSPEMTRASQLFVTNPAGPNTARLGRFRESPIYCARQILKRPGGTWVALAVVHAKPGMNRLRRTLVYGALILAFMCCAVFAGSWLLVKLAFKPLEQIVADAAMVARDGPTRRLATSSTLQELDQLVALLNTMLDSVAGSVSRLRRFSAQAGHELRTPLTRMRSEAELALVGGDPESMQAALASVLEEALELQQIIDALLDLARAEDSPISAPEEINLRSLLDDLSLDAKVVAEGRQVAVSFRPGEDVIVPGEHKLLARCLWNLIDNAIVHTPEGGGVEILLGRSADGRAEVSIQDEGSGVPEELRELIFEAFQRGANGRKGGLGLGLSIARAVATRHQGELSLERSESGARFVLRVPSLPASD